MLYASGTHLLCCPIRAVRFHLKQENCYRLIKVMSVSNTATTMPESVSVDVAEPTPGISPGTGGGGTVGEPTVGTSPVTDAPTPGISPANAVPERTLANVIANNSRFMNCL